jgi:hypothetical protein
MYLSLPFPVNPYIGAKGGKGEFVLRVKLQIQFLLINVMIMGLKLSPSNTNKYITGICKETII